MGKEVEAIKSIRQRTYTFNTDSVLNVKSVLTCRPPCSLSFDIPDGEGVGCYQVNMSETKHI